MKILLAGPGTGKTASIKSIITEHGDSSKFLILSFTNATINDLLEKLRDLKVTDNNCMTLHKFAVKYNHDKSRHVLLKKEIEEIQTISKGTKIEFEKLCDSLSCTTFDQMIARFVEYAKANPLYFKEKLASYDALIVDEYQDFNPNEQSLIDLLMGQIKTSYILGDDDQCIYDFKDASSDKIISFYQDLSNEKLPHDHICYRCPDIVVEHATNLIQVNKKRVSKKWDKSNKTGELKYSQLQSFDDVADAIYNEILKLNGESILILTPVEFAILPIARKFEENKIDFVNYFKDKISIDLITKSWEMKSLFGRFKYLNLVLLGYLKLSTRRKFYELLKKNFDSGADYDALLSLLNSKLPDSIKNNSKDLDSFLLDEYYSDILALYKKSKGITTDEKLEGLFKEIEDEEDKKIKIMSIHKSKGLGAKHVFMVGLNEGIIPNKKRGNDTIESQRRLFYVGMTRTEEKLFLFSNINLEGRYVNTVNKPDFKYDFRGKIWKGKASTFVSELKLS
jgi:DNA helicase II / ATP-dependent DNA helicase PcrA